MNVNKTITRYLILLLPLFLPVLLCLLFPGFFRLTNARINDFFFRLRSGLAGKSAPLSPYLNIYTIDDGPAAAAVNRQTLDDVVNRLHADKTIIINIPSTRVTDNPGKLFFPVMLPDRHPEPGTPLLNTAPGAMGFIPKLLASGNPRSVKPHEFPGPGNGVANLYPDPDGVVRRIPLIFDSGEGYYYPSLFFTALCHYLEVRLADAEITFGRQIRLPAAGFRMMQKDILIPIDARGQMLINYPAPLHVSFPVLSAARLLQAEETPTMPSIVPPPAGFTLLGDVAVWGGKFSAGIYDPVYPDTMILASALNTVFTGNYLHPAAPWENVLLYLPAFVLPGLFLVLMTNRGFKFFLFGLPILYLVILLFAFCTHLFLFTVLHCLPDALPLLLGLPGTVFLLVGFRLLSAEKELLLREEEQEEEAAAALQSDTASFPPAAAGGTDLAKILTVYHIVSRRQIETTEYLLQGMTYKEIAAKQGISVTAVAQNISKIYRKCNVNRLYDFINTIYNNKHEDIRDDFPDDREKDATSKKPGEKSNSDKDNLY